MKMSIYFEDETELYVDLQECTVQFYSDHMTVIKSGEYADSFKYDDIYAVVTN